MSIFQNMGQRAAGGVRDWFSPGEMTYEEMLRRRQIAQTAQTRQHNLSAPGAGFGALADAFVGKIAGGQADAATTKGREGASSALGALLQGRVGGGGMSAPQMNLLPPQQAASGGQMQPQISPDGSIQRPQGMAASVIAGFEGFRETPYWDVNALRTGFGSDTVTMPDGSVQKVGKGTRVSREDAQRDLERRIGTEFMPRAASAVGQERFAQLSPEQQAALTSITYNYGSLPKSVAAAVKTPDPYDDIAAIRALGSHNDGVNAGRRSKEAELYAGNGSPGAMSFAGGSEPNVQFTSQMGGGEGIDPRLAELMQNPYVAELPQAQQGALAALFQQQLGQAYPEQMTPYQQAQVGLQREQFDWQRQQAMQPGANAPASFQALDMQARAAGLEPGSEEYQQFMLNGGAGGSSAPAAFQALDMQAQAAGFERGTPEYREFMATRGSGHVAAATVTGKAQAEAAIGLPGAVSTASRAIANLEAIRDDPALPGITGMVQGRLPPMSQAGTDLNTRIQQAQGQAFLEAFESLKGGGAITEIEGTKAEQAMARLNRAQSTEAYQQALNDLIGVLNSGVARAQQMAQQAGGAPVTAPPPPPESVMPPPPGVDAIENMSDDDLIRRYLGG